MAEESWGRQDECESGEKLGTRGHSMCLKTIVKGINRNQIYYRNRKQTKRRTKTVLLIGNRCTTEVSPL